MAAAYVDVKVYEALKAEAKRRSQRSEVEITIADILREQIEKVINK